MPPKHAWESPEQDRPGRLGEHAWNNGDAFGQDAVPSDSEDEVASPGEQLCSYLKSLLYGRKVSAQDFCTVMWYAHAAGRQEAGPYKYKPTAPSGHFQMHCNTSLEPYRNSHTLYTIETIGKG